MKNKFACLFGATLLVLGSSLYAAETAKPVVAKTMEVKHHAKHAAKQVTIKEIIVKAEAAGYKEITEIKFKKDSWKLEALDKDGKKVDIKMDLEGKIIKVEKDFF